MEDSIEAECENLFSFYPLSYSNPFCRNGVNAPFAVCGSEPDKKGGGILFWAYNIEERNEALAAFKKAGYHNVHWEEYNHEK